jgi:hypothetical protein
MAFKMKHSPAKNLGDFFGSIFSGKAVKRLGDQLKTNRKDIGGEMKKKYSGKAQRANEVPRPGESEYQFKVRTRRARSKKADKPVTKTPEQLENIDAKSKIKIDPTVGMDRYTYISSSKPKTNKQTFKQAFAAARKAGKKTFNFEGKSYTTKLKEENFKVIPGPGGQPVVAEDYEDYGNPINKKNMRKPFKMKGPSGFKLKKSPAKNTRGRLEQKHPTKGNVTGADYEMIRTSDKDRKSYAVGYNVMTKAQKKKHGKPVDGEYVMSKSGHIKRIG